MNYLIQRGKVRQQAISVPDGLPELLSDITREVLRCQPTKDCLCQFIIDYLHSLIVTREKAMVAKSILDRALRQVDSIISDMCVCDLSKEKSDMMAQVMEECFRNFLEKRRCEMRGGKEAIKFADIDMLEELIQKCGFSEEELHISRPTIETAYKRFVDAYMAAAKDTQGTEILYQYFRDRELKRIQGVMQFQAATLIQAAWRGYVVRRTLAQHVCVCTCMLDNKDEEEAKRNDAAARVIQRFFKTVLMRQAIKPMGDPCAEPETPSSMEEAKSAEAKAAAAAAAATAAAETAPSTAPGSDAQLSKAEAEGAPLGDVATAGSGEEGSAGAVEPQETETKADEATEPAGEPVPASEQPLPEEAAPPPPAEETPEPPPAKEPAPAAEEAPEAD